MAVGIYKSNPAELAPRHMLVFDARLAAGPPPLMPAAAYDFAIFGSTPLAGLLAGLLATAHHKAVCLVGGASSAFRLPRAIDLSVSALTRPDSWALLRQTTPETVKLLGDMHIPRQGVRKVDPIFVAETSEGADALSHMRHLAEGFGIGMERTQSPAIGGTAYTLQDAVLLHRATVEPAIMAWLAKAGVGLLTGREGSVTIRRDGSARLEHAGATIEAQHAVLADDAAILAHLEVDERDRTLAVLPAMVILTEPTGPLPSPAMLYVDRDVTLMRSRSGAVTGIGIGRTEDAIERIGGCLAGRGPLRRAGQHVFRTVTTVDGAPLVGAARGLKATVLAGLGPSGAFLAPAIARRVAGAATEAEQAWFATHEAGRGNARAQAAEFRGGGLLETQH